MGTCAKTVQRPPQQPAQPPVRQRRTPNDTSQNALTRCSTRRGERVTVQGPGKKSQPDRMSHRAAGGGASHGPLHCVAVGIVLDNVEPLNRMWGLSAGPHCRPYPDCSACAAFTTCSGARLPGPPIWTPYRPIGMASGPLRLCARPHFAAAEVPERTERWVCAPVHTCQLLSSTPTSPHTPPHRKGASCALCTVCV